MSHAAEHVESENESIIEITWMKIIICRCQTQLITIYQFHSLWSSPPVNEPTVFRICGEHVDHYNTEAMGKTFKFK
jgi:hypothetical protein